ncbi:Protein of unknown function [Aliiroseovarius halocynthiae]|uniref:DUF3035 domain-containing protein n=1 Tax=Aliiroseovarius halocynthiae TaxID=985055 RepID=A0A545SPA2_9RHOB|nr:DUF3035 domain-containing protein [Aliiroseovarius halocynthiae]TQV66777.1 DUF3035 domain-containing protein [Aliiroseovarius halocynthiae]SMR82396.1 Protein of unknown function [Aliiroseovarius halocynthiae]
MRISVVKFLAFGVLLLGLSACAKRDNSLMNLRATQGGPDEFAILPTKPLQEPKSYAELPTPTPGRANLADPTPEADAVAALGGNLREGTLRGGEGALVSAASRYGVSANIREVLAAQDAEWRKDNRGRLLERLFNVNVYYRAYDAVALNQHGELARLRRLGLWTPAAPPQVVTDQ